MKIALSFFLILAFISISLLSQNKTPEIPEGMQLIKIGKTNVIVPIDTRIRHEGGLVILEAWDQYIARRLLQQDEEIKKLRAHQEELQKEIDELKDTLRQLQERSSDSQAKT